jgi:hypothetical protein
MADQTFTAGQVLTADQMTTLQTNIGLSFISTTSFSASTGVEIRNCLSSTYTNYEVLINWFGSTSSNLALQFMTGTNTRDTSAAYNRYGFYWLTNALTSFDQASQTSFFIANFGTANFSNAQQTLFNPNVANRTEIRNRAYSGDSNLAVYTDGTVNNSTVYTGLYLLPAAGNITGSISVYGYRKA